MAPAICRHCCVKSAGRPRGLCWSCYYTDGIRDLYPVDSKFACHGIVDRAGKVKKPRKATDALPGTPEKLAVLIERAACGFDLWHKSDMPMDLESRKLGYG